MTPRDIACREEPGQPSCQTIRAQYMQIMGADGYIHRKHSPVMKYWFDRMHKILDDNYEKLKEFPARTNWQSAGVVINVNGKSVRT